MKGMRVDKYGNITFTADAKEMTSEEMRREFDSIQIGPVHDTIEIKGNQDGSVTTTTTDHITGEVSVVTTAKFVNPARVSTASFSRTDAPEVPHETQESLALGK